MAAVVVDVAAAVESRYGLAATGITAARQIWPAEVARPDTGVQHS